MNRYTPEEMKHHEAAAEKEWMKDNSGTVGREGEYGRRLSRIDFFSRIYRFSSTGMRDDDEDDEEEGGPPNPWLAQGQMTAPTDARSPMVR